MNFAGIIRYIWLLVQTRNLQWAYVRVRIGEISDRQHTGRARLNSKH